MEPSLEGFSWQISITIVVPCIQKAEGRARYLVFRLEVHNRTALGGREGLWAVGHGPRGREKADISYQKPAVFFFMNHPTEGCAQQQVS